MPNENTGNSVPNTRTTPSSPPPLPPITLHQLWMDLGNALASHPEWAAHQVRLARFGNNLVGDHLPYLTGALFGYNASGLVVLQMVDPDHE